MKSMNLRTREQQAERYNTTHEQDQLSTKCRSEMRWGDGWAKAIMKKEKYIKSGGRELIANNEPKCYLNRSIIANYSLIYSPQSHKEKNPINQLKKENESI